jgi:head-tail adaptor
MALSNTLKDRVTIQLRVATQTALGETVNWVPVETRYARVIPLDAKARAVYQQLNSSVSHQVVLRGAVSLNLGLNRLKWGDKTLEPVEPAQEIAETSMVMVREV